MKRTQVVPMRTPQPEARATTPDSFMLVPSRRQSLGDQLYGQLLEQIVEGKLRKGDRLPPEKELCRLFGVSRPIVREALTKLRADGLVQARQGDGTYVANQPASRLTSFASSTEIAALLRCIEIRLPLEGVTARLAAERRSSTQLARITAAHADFIAELEGGLVSAKADMAFHLSIAAATGNTLFESMFEHLSTVILSFMGLNLSLTRTGPRERKHQLRNEHDQVLEAIRIQDPEAAQIAMQFHISQARRRMVGGAGPSRWLKDEEAGKTAI